MNIETPPKRNSQETDQNIECNEEMVDESQEIDKKESNILYSMSRDGTRGIYYQLVMYLN